jgi:hypothetical protein
MANIEIRRKKFDKLFYLDRSNPYYNKLKYLYVNDVLKSSASVNKYFEKIKLKDNKELYKNSVKYANELNDRYEKIYNKTTLKQNELNKRFVRIDENNVENFGIWIHEAEIRALQKSNRNGYYVQTTKFYNKSNQLKDGEYKPVNIKTTLMLNTKAKRKIVYEQIMNKLTVGGSEYDWKVRTWIYGEENAGFVDEGIKRKNIGHYATIETIVFSNIQKVNNIINQVYQESESLTCVYDGFLKFFNNSNCKDKKTVYNKLIKNFDKYAKSYTDETLYEICEFTKTNLIIKDLINGNDKKFNVKNARFNIEFLNTKYNHLDVIVHSYNEITEVDGINEYNQIKEENKFYIESMGQLITLDKIYKVKDTTFKKIYKEWKEKNNYNDLLIDIDQAELINLYDHSSHCFFNDFEVNNKLYDELDIEKAYFNYSNKQKNEYYHGVPSGSFINLKCEDNFNIDTFNKQLKNGLIGFYQVSIEKINKYFELYNKIGIKENNIYIFTSVQINGFKDDVEFKFLNLSISPCVDIPFSEIMLESENDLKHYCKAYGLLNVISDDIKITIKPLLCDVEYFSLIQNDNINIYEYNGLVHITQKNKNIKTASHIYNYIHSYTKNLIFQQLKEIDINDVFGVKLDSIVIKKEAKINKRLSCFHKEFKKCNIEVMLKEKTKINDYMKFLGFEEVVEEQTYYKPLFSNVLEIVNFKSSFLPNNEMITSKVIFLSGKGGSGKSHSILNNLKNVCMVSCCWNLTQAKKEEYETLKPLSINKLVGITNDKKTEKVNIKSKFLFFDELTMWNKKDVLSAIKDYQNKFIFLAGDIDYDGRFYQCNLDNEVIKPNEIKNCQYVVYVKNYRFDEQLNNILDGLREHEKIEDQIKYINIHFKDNFKNKEDVDFDNKTIGISDIKDTEELTKHFISKGTEPQYYIKNTNINKGEYKGARLDKEPDHQNFECKLFKTIHSFQGLDLKRDEKIIISVKKYFDSNLFYTAFSRARNLNQIIILKN